MQKTKKFIRFVLVIALCMPCFAAADEKEEAETISKKIVELLGQGKFAEIWDNYTAKSFKSTVTRDSYLANMSIGRQMFGKLESSSLVDVNYSTHDPATGYNGAIYSFTYLNNYSQVKAYERIVVIDQDGSGFKLAGLWGSPAQ
jgi:uncharacterized protein DUF4019